MLAVSEENQIVQKEEKKEEPKKEVLTLEDEYRIEIMEAKNIDELDKIVKASKKEVGLNAKQKATIENFAIWTENSKGFYRDLL